MGMAKGWESKAVEDQIQASQEADQENPRKQFTPEQMEAHRRKEVLLLSRTHVEKDLNASQNPRYRDQLIQALAHIDAQLSKMKDVD
jgi:hypothetical protein